MVGKRTMCIGKTVPLCPECGEPMERLRPVESGVCYLWNNGKFEVDDAQEIIIFVHDLCDKTVGGWRADGERWGFVPELEG